MAASRSTKMGKKQDPYVNTEPDPVDASLANLRYFVKSEANFIGAAHKHTDSGDGLRPKNQYQSIQEVIRESRNEVRLPQGRNQSSKPPLYGDNSSNLLLASSSMHTIPLKSQPQNPYDSISSNQLKHVNIKNLLLQYQSAGRNASAGNGSPEESLRLLQLSAKYDLDHQKKFSEFRESLKTNIKAGERKKP